MKMCTNYDELLDWALAQGIVKQEEKAGVLDGTTTNEIMDVVESMAIDAGVWMPIQMQTIDPVLIVGELLVAEIVTKVEGARA